MEQEDIDKSVFQPRNFYICVVVGPLFFAVGLYFFLFHFLAETNRYFDYKDATKVPVAQIIELDLDCDEGSCSIEVEYTFDYEWKTYTSQYASIYRGGDNFGTFQRDLFERISYFKENKSDLYCYVLSKSPEEAVIDRSFRESRCAVTVLFTIVFSGMGGYISIYALRNRKRYFSTV